MESLIVLLLELPLSPELPLEPAPLPELPLEPAPLPELPLERQPPYLLTIQNRSSCCLLPLSVVLILQRHQLASQLVPNRGQLVANF